MCIGKIYEILLVIFVLLDEEPNEGEANLRERISLNSAISDYIDRSTGASIPTTPSSNGNPDTQEAFTRGTPSGYESGESGNIKIIYSIV